MKLLHPPILICLMLISACSATPSLESVHYRTLYSTTGNVYPGGWENTDHWFYATLHHGDDWSIIRLNTETRAIEPVIIPLTNAGISDVRGDELLIESNVDDQYDVFVFNLRNRNLQRVTNTSADEWHPAFGLGSAIIHDSNDSDVLNVYRTDRNTGNTEKLTTNPASEQAGKLSPDGTKLAFHRHMGGENYDVIVMDIETRTEINITLSPADDSYPQWTAGGRSIIFSSNRNGDFDLFEACVATRDTGIVISTPLNEKYPRLNTKSDLVAYQVKIGGASEIRTARLHKTVRCPSKPD